MTIIDFLVILVVGALAMLAFHQGIIITIAAVLIALVLVRALRGERIP